VTKILLRIVKNSPRIDNTTGFLCCFRCWDDDDENGVVLWIIKGPIVLTVLVRFFILS